MIIGISGKIGSGKDTVGQIIQYLTAYGEHDTFENFLNASHGNIQGGANPWKIKKFADKLKDIICLLIGCTGEQLEDQDFKNTELGEEWWYYGAYQHGSHKDILESIHVLEKDARYILEYSHMNYVKLIKLTPRKILQLLGIEVGRDIIHPNIWINALFTDYKYIPGNRKESEGRIGDLMTQFPKWIITDTRFINEAQSIKNRKGIIIRVNRNQEPKVIICPNKLKYERLENGSYYLAQMIVTDNPKNFKSFKKLSDYFDLDKQLNNISVEHESETALDDYQDFDYIIDNNGTINDLIIKIKEILIKEKII